MTSKDNPILFSPEDGLDKGKEVSDPKYTPFIQLILSKTSSQNQKIAQEKIEAVQIQIQKMMLDVETGTLKLIVSIILWYQFMQIKNIIKISEVFSQDDKDPTKVKEMRTNFESNFKSASPAKIQKEIEKSEDYSDEESERNFSAIYDSDSRPINKGNYCRFRLAS